MEARRRLELMPNDLELWTMDDAETWREADAFAKSQLWLDDDPVLDDDLWMEDVDALSIRGLARLGIRGGS